MPDRAHAGGANAQLAQRAIDEFNATRRFGPVFDELVHPNVSFKDEIGAYDNREEVRRFLEGFAESIGGLRVDVTEVREVGDTVILSVIQSGLGTASEIPIAQPFTWVMRFAGDRCVWWRIYADYAQALDELGLSD